MNVSIVLKVWQPRRGPRSCFCLLLCLSCLSCVVLWRGRPKLTQPLALLRRRTGRGQPCSCPRSLKTRSKNKRSQSVRHVMYCPLSKLLFPNLGSVYIYNIINASPDWPCKSKLLQAISSSSPLLSSP